jgi:hypothetical protein
VNESIQTIEDKLSYRDRYIHISETISLNELLTRFSEVRKIVSESLNLLEFDGQRILTIIRSINETLRISESFSRLQNMSRFINETESIIESLTKEVLSGLVTKTKSVGIFGRSKGIGIFSRSKIAKVFNRGKRI